MEQSKKAIKREIKKMEKYQEIGEDDIIVKRIVYAVSEALRWSIENTVGWEKPLQQAISNAEILKQELKNE